MHKLVMPKYIFEEIVCVVSESRDGLETGVTLFGTIAKEHHAVIAVAGPGRNATHESARYSGDDAHANAIFRALRSALPGIRWLGELHVHPKGMTWLSRGDLETVRAILTGTDDTLHPQEFIGGVMQRRNGTVDIHPFHFTRESLRGLAMELRIVDSHAPEVEEARRNSIEERKQHDGPSFCTESKGSRTFVREAPRNCWLRQWWERLGRYGRKGGHRQVDTH